MSIYTKKGDGGETDLFDPKTYRKMRLSKDDLRLEVIGTIDELVSCLGIVKTLIDRENEDRDRVIIEQIQKDLFAINSIVAGVKLNFSKSKVNFLEKEINKLEKELPPLTKFVIPGKNMAESFLHLSRSICRRGERRLVELSRKQKVNPNVLIYLNRLSDLFFMLARAEI
jgi:cob(I)alamin adenosyltransferase